MNVLARLSRRVILHNPLNVREIETTSGCIVKRKSRARSPLDTRQGSIVPTSVHSNTDTRELANSR